MIVNDPSVSLEKCRSNSIVDIIHLKPIQQLSLAALEDIEKSRHYISLVADKKMERVLFKVIDSNLDIDSSKFASDLDYRRLICCSLIETLDEKTLESTLNVVEEFGIDRSSVFSF
jgi:hypothetical protein